ncbi:carboxymuconolactone decarboxylase [Planosporangium flavigriseum]|uniref:Carboxymuconolactone decarboxylase n=1 Tax=Planosporangium flavigriseum TaxID=373681 RepID=A0A8J3LX55_9ACTN|nr:carboxymuconolactone decarboxylase family protein [Planosporangium flavigriseum]NJC66123.1 carboxymuconolactone decarboxylase [Planosporangium flavigriseum]GIG75186.1 carboxymuconolactone decarboxylase [Planosporangium flavigriseum]
MPYIELPPNLPGIAGPIAQYPETGGPLNALAEALLRGPSSLTPGERETIAAYVSSRNACRFCAETHSAVARHLLGDDAEIVDQVRAGGDRAPVDPKLKALLAIADKVRDDGRNVTADDVARARAAGADDKAVHDTVLIAAAFCMFNRYVDGLATWAPVEPEAYVDHGKTLAETGYLRSSR